VHEAECLGSCGTAPMMSVNKTYHEKLNPEKINALIDELKAKG
jgi:NADH-quinone oxidoreductase subunit E